MAPPPLPPPELDPWDFHLPDEAIADHPPADRDGGRLMHLVGPATHHRQVRDLSELLRPGDLLVANDSAVRRARLVARRRPTGGQVELLFVGVDGPRGRALLRPSRRLSAGSVLEAQGLRLRLETDPQDGQADIVADGDLDLHLAQHGEVPLPPYLARKATHADAERYQTTYARVLGSAAAPTAGLHLSMPLRARLADRGVAFATVTLHVGLGTFKPLTAEALAEGALHPERFTVLPEAAAACSEARSRGGRIVAVGTTTVRALHTAQGPDGRIRAMDGTTRLFLRPPDRTSAVDGLLTNFHLPRSSLLMLVSTFVGRERLLSAYREALATGYRFASYGDAMLIL